jgi:hypothetical protein
MKTIGIILIVLGILALVYQGFSYTQTKQVAQLGPVQINDQEHHYVWVPPVVGGAFIVVGAASVVLSGRSKF